MADITSLETVYKELERLGREKSEWIAVGSIGSSSEGRDIKAAFVTDKSVPNQEKEVVLVVSLRHGDEGGTIAVSLSLLGWLLSEEGAETRRRQLVIVVPVANPDGLARREFWAPNDRLNDTETQTIYALAETYRPDVVIDVHSLGRGDLEAVITGHDSHGGEDDFIHGMLAGAMVNGAGAKGYPFLLHTFGVQSLAPCLVPFLPFSTLTIIFSAGFATRNCTPLSSG